ncbi:MAG TPA: o-succinylbenzoate synthase [Bacteroidales bacterium]|nr:o-succinylbenzoate synthase [Bacteroidales bacterium]HRX95927.1 o-succinylbenzoate synthase [Bacteroidales bacterium]
MRKIWFKKYTLQFKFDAGTSRGVMRTRDSWFVFIQLEDGKTGIGECAPLPGLSCDSLEQMETKLQHISETGAQIPENFPSIGFGIEMAEKDLQMGGKRILFPSDFTNGSTGIPINGLVWMGDLEFMQKQVKEKISAGFTCVKFKIGAIDFEKELDLIRQVRKEFSAKDIEIRVDANGAFKPEEALEKLKRLSDHNLHSIEQPIRQNQWEQMAMLCEKTPLPIALDEELIGIQNIDQKAKLLSEIKPQYIILKPSLLGGFAASEAWIKLAENSNIGWWVTSALESNIGLNAIAQWTYTLKNPMPQGLGTGQLFTNNFDSPLYIDKGELYHNSLSNWDLSKLM